MGPSRIFKIFLLALLPAIGIVIYLQGQDYNPNLISFKEPLSSGSDAAMESFLPDRICGLNRLGGAVRSYTKETLYEVIDGHAEYFISAGFNRLSIGDYGRTGGDANSPALVINIYDMMKDIQAFGVLGDESGGQTKGTSSEIFTTGSSQRVNFTCGKYYVQVMAYDKTIPVDEVQKEIRLKIGIKDEDLPELARFPNLGEVLRTRYVRESYRGISFFNNVIEREYGAAGGKFNVSLFFGNEDEIKKTTELFIKYFRESKIDYTQTDIKGRTIYRVKDPYEGDWVLIPMSDSLFGLYGSFNEDNIAKILEGQIKIDDI
jgi:hypothetical protein